MEINAAADAAHSLTSATMAFSYKCIFLTYRVHILYIWQHNLVADRHNTNMLISNSTFVIFAVLDVGCMTCRRKLLFYTYNIKQSKFSAADTVDLGLHC